MAKEDAQTAYNQAKADIASLLGWFECELNKTPGKIDWTHVGTLNKIKQDLLETLSFLSGFAVETINESLTENRMLEEADDEIENERQ